MMMMMIIIIIIVIIIIDDDWWLLMIIDDYWWLLMIIDNCLWLLMIIVDDDDDDHCCYRVTPTIIGEWKIKRNSTDTNNLRHLEPLIMSLKPNLKLHLSTDHQSNDFYSPSIIH